jgi:general secretion pathway protein G
MILSRKHAQSGFSLTEIMIAIAIMAILAVTVVPGFMAYLNRAKVSRAKQDLRAIQAGIDMYYGDIGQYPASLRDLVKRPADEKIGRKWQEGYIKGKDVPKDPWGNKYQYELTQGKEHPYELYSYGKNGKGSPSSEWISVWDEE